MSSCLFKYVFLDSFSGHRILGFSFLFLVALQGLTPLSSKFTLCEEIGHQPFWQCFPHTIIFCLFNQKILLLSVMSSKHIKVSLDCDHSTLLGYSAHFQSLDSTSLFLEHFLNYIFKFSFIPLFSFLYFRTPSIEFFFFFCISLTCTPYLTFSLYSI